MTKTSHLVYLYSLLLPFKGNQYTQGNYKIEIFILYSEYGSSANKKAPFMYCFRHWQLISVQCELYNGSIYINDFFLLGIGNQWMSYFTKLNKSALNVIIILDACQYYIYEASYFPVKCEAWILLSLNLLFNLSPSEK